MLYEMLSGAVPFKASTPSAVLIKHLQEMPVPLRKLRREVPAPIERVVMQALEKKPLLGMLGIFSSYTILPVAASTQQSTSARFPMGQRKNREATRLNGEAV